MLFAQPLQWYIETSYGPFGVYTYSSHGSTLMLGNFQLWVRCEFETAKIIFIVGGILIPAAITFVVIWTVISLRRKVMLQRTDRTSR